MDNHNSTSDGDDELQHLVVKIVDGEEEEQKPKLRVSELSTVLEPSGLSILSEVSVEILAGSIVGIIGPSGSGKSTFLRALNRMWDPPKHTVFLDNQDIHDLDVLSLRRKIGMLFQVPALFPGTVADNIRYGPKLTGKKLSDDEVTKLLALADLDSSFANKNGNELSVGQAQRVALARTLANDPEVLLLDEPTSALDPISTQAIEDTILKLKKTHKLTTVIVSHSVRQIQRIVDIIYLLVEGKIVEVLRPDRLSEASHPMARKFLELS
ncbi:hypothetical protein MKW98_012606 [Papaver atlanticum]|uniref:ABC transporter domain-containing protein n=1 Tax=Papaver atlanticum TaxID=357466 RepID=A0AAD4XPD5_9MAGN|nr:hypothetical protein MKW98_012606 [Papaver atlanticum]